MAVDGNDRDKNEYEAPTISETAMAQLFRGELSEPFCRSQHIHLAGRGNRRRCM